MKTNQIVPNSQRLPGFPGETLSLAMCREERPKHYIFMCFCACSPHSTDHKAHAGRRVYMREMDGGGRTGVLQGLGVGPLSFTHSCLSISICSFPETAAELRRNVMGKVPVWMVTTHGVTGADRHPSVR